MERYRYGFEQETIGAISTILKMRVKEIGNVQKVRHQKVTPIIWILKKPLIPSFSFQYCSHFSLEYCRIKIILDRTFPLEADILENKEMAY